jgi:lactate permease
MVWTQSYDPVGNPILSTMLAAFPVVLLLGLLATGRVRAPVAALAGLATTLVMAVFVFVPLHSAESPVAAGEMSYWQAVGSWTPAMIAAALNGAAFGLLPIGWIVLAAIFLYSLTVETGQFEIVKHSVAALSQDRRIQALLIAFSFGAFVEGAAGFGTPVAISAALLMGAGFKPLHAAGLALLANTSPVAFGALGTPIITLAKVTGLPEARLSAMAGRQLPIFSVIVPIWLVWVMAGWRGLKGIWPALLVSGGSFAVVQCAVANLLGPALVDVLGGLVSLVCLALLLRLWQPAQIWRFDHDPPADMVARLHTTTSPSPTPPQIFNAWVPWILLTVFVLLWGFPSSKALLGIFSDSERKQFQQGDSTLWVKRTTILVKVPKLNRSIERGAEVDPSNKREDALFELNWLSATGTGIFLAAVASAFWLRIPPARLLHQFLSTCYRMRWPIFTIACMLAIAFTTRYSGMDATLGLAFTKTGWIYPLFAALLGWLGVALTGSDTSSNALFGSLQTITANQLAGASGPLSHLGSDSAQILLATANSTGGVMGKMIDAQSIVVAAAATQQHGQEGPILRFVFLHSLILAVLMGLLVLAQAYLWPAIIP